MRRRVVPKFERGAAKICSHIVLGYAGKIIRRSELTNLSILVKLHTFVVFGLGAASRFDATLHIWCGFQALGMLRSV